MIIKKSQIYANEQASKIELKNLNARVCLAIIKKVFGIDAYKMRKNTLNQKIKEMMRHAGVENVDHAYWVADRFIEIDDFKEEYSLKANPKINNY